MKKRSILRENNANGCRGASFLLRNWEKSLLLRAGRTYGSLFSNGKNPITRASCLGKILKMVRSMQPEAKKTQKVAGSHFRRKLYLVIWKNYVFIEARWRVLRATHWICIYFSINKWAQRATNSLSAHDRTKDKSRGPSPTEMDRRSQSSQGRGRGRNIMFSCNKKNESLYRFYLPDIRATRALATLDITASYPFQKQLELAQVPSW